MTYHEMANGARIFATGTMQWSWGLDDYNAPALRSIRTSEAAQQITRNVLRLLMGGIRRPNPEPAPRPGRQGENRLATAVVESSLYKSTTSTPSFVAARSPRHFFWPGPLTCLYVGLSTPCFFGMGVVPAFRYSA